MLDIELGRVRVARVRPGGVAGGSKRHIPNANRIKCPQDPQRTTE